LNLIRNGRGRKGLLVLLCAGLVLAACSDADEESFGGGDGCKPVTVASSPEKLELLTGLAEEFNGSEAGATAAGGECVQIQVARKSSGVGAELLTQGWPENEANGPQPVIWSPAASSWGSRPVSNSNRIAPRL